MRAFAGGIAEYPLQRDEPILLRDVVPVVRERNRIAAILEASSAGQRPVPQLVHQPLNALLEIIFAIHIGDSFRYLLSEELATLRLEEQPLLTIAIDNLNRILPPIEIANSGGILVVSAGGIYESSILLLDKFWNKARLGIAGEIAVGLPARAEFYIVDSTQPFNMTILEKTCRVLAKCGKYPITPQVFFRGEGALAPVPVLDRGHYLSPAISWILHPRRASRQ